jgi:hypothetical protein
MELMTMLHRRKSFKGTTEYRESASVMDLKDGMTAWDRG